MDPYKKAAAFFRVLIPISISINLIAKIVFPSPPLWLILAAIVLLLIAAVGIYVCENRLLGVRSEQERRELWRPNRRLRALSWAATAVVLVLGYIVLFG